MKIPSSFDNLYDKDDKSSKDNDPHYNENQICLIRMAYILGIIGWIILIIGYHIFPPNNAPEFVILLIPIIVFLISWKSIPFISEKVELYMFNANILTLGLLVALPILTWIYKKSKNNRGTFIRILITAIIFSVLGLIDIWVPEERISVIKHTRSIFQTIALTLFIFVLYRFFIERDARDRMKNHIKKSKFNHQ